MTDLPSYTAFDGNRCLAAGPLAEVAIAVKRATEAESAGPLLVFADADGRVVDLDLRGDDDAVLARLSPGSVAPSSPVRGRGRPKLGVVAREVTLLPRHWDWLSAQPGGASVALRKLVEGALRQGGDGQRLRAARETAYRVMAALAGNFAGFEEATRALFASDREKFRQETATWPDDVLAYVLRLAFPVGSEHDSLR